MLSIDLQKLSIPHSVGREETFTFRREAEKTERSGIKEVGAFHGHLGLRQNACFFHVLQPGSSLGFLFRRGKLHTNRVRLQNKRN